MEDSSTPPLKLVGLTTRLYTRVVDRPLRELGFALSQVPVLGLLKVSGALSQAELARRMQVEQPSMAQCSTAWSATAWYVACPIRPTSAAA